MSTAPQSAAQKMERQQYGLRKQVLTRPYGVCVCREPSGRSVFESTDYDTAKRELARLNAGGSEHEHFRPVERYYIHQRDGSLLAVPIKNTSNANSL